LRQLPNASYNCAPFLGAQMKRRKNEPLPLLQIGVGTILSSMVVAGLLLGYVTDQFFETSPLFMLMFGFLGVVGGILKAHRLLTYSSSQKIEKDGK